MLNALLPGTQVAIHKHPNSSENIICLCGRIDEIFYNEDGTQEVEFFGRDANNLIPIDVKATDGKVKSIKSFIEDKNIKDINFGIKLAEKNIGFENNIYTFPYFLTFLLKRFLSEKK